MHRSLVGPLRTAHCPKRSSADQVLAMYHGDGGNLKDKVRGMTNHNKRLPQAQRSQMIEQRKRPIMMSAMQQEAAILGDADPEDPLDKDPEDPEAVKALRQGDEALHEGDMAEAVKLCASILPTAGPVLVFLRAARVQECARLTTFL